MLTIVHELYDELDEDWCPEGRDPEAEVRGWIEQKRAM